MNVSVGAGKARIQEKGKVGRVGEWVQGEKCRGYTKLLKIPLGGKLE